MAGNTFGTIFRVTTFGESHGEGLGAVIDGCPAGVPIDVQIIQKELNRRRPGNHSATKEDGDSHAVANNPAVTSRREEDKIEVLSGIFEGFSTGTPITLLIRNTAQKSRDYSALANTFRPGHADYTYTQKYGIRDYRGGGRSSGRETVARVAAGAIARMVLQAASTSKTCAHEEINIIAYTKEAAGIKTADIPFDKIDTSVIEQNPMRAADLQAAPLMSERVAELRKKGDSAGGIIECIVRGVPSGWGEPVFDKLDAELARAIMSIGAVKGIEFGAGFESSRMTGAEWNDAMRVENSNNVNKSPQIRFATNNAGGILGGISNGNTIVFRVAVKPVPSIFLPQQTVQIEKNEQHVTTYKNTELNVEGRHDVCLCPRIIPVIEAMVAITLADMYLRSTSCQIK